MTDRHLTTWLLSVPADSQGGDAVTEETPLGLHDALSVRTLLYSQDREAEGREHEISRCDEAKGSVVSHSDRTNSEVQVGEILPCPEKITARGETGKAGKK